MNFIFSWLEPGMRIGTDYQAVIPDLEEGLFILFLQTYNT